MTPAVWLLTWISMSPSSRGLGARPGREHREVAVGLLAPRGCDHMEHDPEDEQHHAHRSKRPAGHADGDASDFPTERTCRRRGRVPALDGVADALDEAQVGGGEDAEAHHG